MFSRFLGTQQNLSITALDPENAKLFLVGHRSCGLGEESSNLVSKGLQT